MLEEQEGCPTCRLGSGEVGCEGVDAKGNVPPVSPSSNDKIVLQGDAVPYFPFSLDCEEKCWIFQSPFSGLVREVNQSAYLLLVLCDGYRTWEEITSEVARSYRIGRSEVIRLSTPLLEEMTNEGVLWWRRQRMSWWDMPPPTTVLWDLTSRCNLRCRHCVVSGGDSGAHGDLGTEQCIRLIDDLATFGVRQLILSGGEPLMRPDFFKIAENVAKRDLYFQVSTNATLIDVRAAERLATLRAEAQVSLDGATPEIHDWFRQSPGSWKRAVEGIRNLVAVGVPVMLAATVTKNNISEIPALYKLAADLEVQKFRILPFVPLGRGGSYRDIEVAPRDMRDLTGFLLRMREQGEIPVISMEFECTFSQPPVSLPDPQTRIGCDGAVDYCTITSSGEVYPCNFFAGSQAENVKDHSFAWIWKHSRFLNYFRSITVSDLHGPCRSCTWLAYCRGSCIATNFAHRDIFQSNCHCWLVEEKSLSRSTLRRNRTRLNNAR